MLSTAFFIMKVYLSGGIEYANNYGKDWRIELGNWIKNNLEHIVFNPTVESINFFKNEFPEFSRDNLKSMPIEEIRKIVGSLICFEISTVINEIDYIICYWDESCYKGAGTQGELTAARYNNIPVLIVSHIRKEIIPSWIIGCSTEIFPNFEDLKKYLLEKYLSL